MSPFEAATLTTDSSLTISQYADLFGFPPEAVLTAVLAQVRKPKPWNTVQDLRVRWQCSKGTVYNVIRETDARVLNLGAKNKPRGALRLSADAVLRIEEKRKDLLGS